MKPLVFLAFAALGLAACQEPSSPSAPGDKTAAPEVSAKAQKGELIPGQYVVVFRGDVRDVKKAAKALAGKHGAKLKRTYEAALKGMAIELPDSAAAALRQEPAVEFVEQNQVVRLTAEPIIQPGATAGLDRIDQRLLPLSGTYSYSNAGAGVHVYILDTGLNFGHIDFGGRAVLGTDVSWFTTPDGVDCNGHGTHVAGTIGGTTYGVAKKVQLVAVRVLDCQGAGNIFTVLDGIDWVTRNAVYPAVANMSLGTGYSQSINEAVTNSILKRDMVYVVAAGNNAADACNFSPASAGGVLTVAASDHGDGFAPFSNSGTCVDLEAPGVDITSDWIGSDNATATISGTSMAAPHVAGAAALTLWARAASGFSDVALALTTYATGGVVTSVPAGTPNRLLYTGFLNSNHWEALAPLERPRRELALGTWNGNIYAIGGVEPTGTVAGVATYRPGLVNVWQPVAPLPAARQAGDGAVVVSGLLYAPGGYNTSNVLTRSLYAYSLYTNTWVAKASIPITSGCGTSQAISNRLYVLTGCTGATSTATGLLHRYNPKTNTWVARKSAPHAHRYPAAGVIAGKLYVVGGYNGTGVSATLDVYDPTTDTWVTKASMPTARRGAAGATYGGKLYVIGGHNQAGNDIATVEVYDPATNTWAARAPLPTARSGLGAVVVNGLISAVGGRNGTKLLGTHEVYRP